MKPKQSYPGYESPEIQILAISTEQVFAQSVPDSFLPFDPDAPDYEDGMYF